MTVMLKSAVHTILAAFLFLTTSGVTVYQHSCMGALVESNLLHAPESCCGEACDCCDDEAHSYQLDEDFLLFSSSSVSIDLPVQPLVDLFAENPVWLTEEVRAFFPAHSHSPPDIFRHLSLYQVFIL